MKLKFEVVGSNIAGLAQGFHVNPASCDNPGFYENYLSWISYSDFTSGENTTHVLLNEDDADIVGFLALRATSIVSNGTSLKGSPALEISVLAINQKYEGQGFGKLLIDMAIAQAKFLHERAAGVKDIVLMADENAVGFYQKCRFSVLEDYMNIPHENWSKNCVPMILRLGFGLGPSYATDEEDEDEDDT